MNFFSRRFLSFLLVLLLFVSVTIPVFAEVPDNSDTLVILDEICDDLIKNGPLVLCEFNEYSYSEIVKLFEAEYGPLEEYLDTQLRDGPGGTLLCPFCKVNRSFTYKPESSTQHGLYCNTCNYRYGYGPHTPVINGAYLVCSQCSYVIGKI